MASLLLAAPCTGCSYESTTLPELSPDAALFEAEVYPILLRDCAFFACHGNTARFFRIYGPGRTRISDSLFPYDPVTPEEVEHTYERARSMLRGVHGVDDSMLLRMPLDAEAGGSGAGHKGLDAWGHNVYRTREDAAYQVLWRWAHAQSDATQSSAETSP